MANGRRVYTPNRNPPVRPRQTLCWDCAKACGDCSWTQWREYRPVPGWKAEPRTMKNQCNGSYETWCVIACPEFERDATNGGAYRIRKIDKNGDAE